jgi:hypothetical protein
MIGAPRSQTPFEVMREQTSSDELVKRIRKLRWMGMREEAERAELELARSRCKPAETVIAGPYETD